VYILKDDFDHDLDQDDDFFQHHDPNHDLGPDEDSWLELFR
jgi:hypothetical protein